MSISSDSYAALDDLSNRLAGESILAQVGRDDGLIPAYSLLGELIEVCSLSPELREPLTTLKADLEKQLDNAQPFDEATLAHLRSVVKWLPLAAAASKTNAPTRFILRSSRHHVERSRPRRKPGLTRAASA